MECLEALKKPKNLLLVVDVSIMVVSFIFLVLNFYEINTSYTNFELLDNALVVWKKHPLIAPEELDIDDESELGIESPIFSEFPSSILGYYCSPKEQIKSGEIPRKKRNDDCFEIKPTESNKIKQWKGFGSFTAYFTYSKLNYFDYMELGYISKTEDCGEFLKNCGIIDSKRQHLCLPREYSCPLIDMEILKNGEFNETFWTDLGYHKVIPQSEDPYTLFYIGMDDIKDPTILNTTLVKSEVCSHFIIDNVNPCADPSKMQGEIYKFELFTTFDRYKKNDCDEKFAHNQYNAYYRLIDNFASKSLFQQNDKDFPIYLTIPETLKNKWDNLTLNLYARNYPGIDVDKYYKVKKNLNDYDSEKLTDKINESEYRFFLVNFFFIVCFVSTFLLVAFKSSQKCYYLVRTVRLSQDVFIFIFTLISIAIHKGFNVDNTAFDPQLSQNLSKLKKSIKLQFILSICEIVFSVIFIALDVVGIKLTEKIEEQYKRVGTVNSEFYN